MAGVASVGARKRFVPNSARLNYSHPLAAGLLFCGVPRLGVDLARNMVGTRRGPVDAASQFGAAFDMSWANNITGHLELTSGPHSIAIAFSKNIFSTNYTVSIARYTFTSASSNTGWALGGTLDSASTQNYTVYSNLANELIATTSTYHGTQFGTSDGTTRRLFLDMIQSNQSSSSPIFPLATTGELRMGDNSNHRVALACIWNRTLNDAERSLFVEDPFCLLSY